MEKTAIIVAGGSGLRMGKDIPKQFLLLAQKPILMHTIEAFFQYNPFIAIVLVLPKSQIEYWQNLCIKYNFNIPLCIAHGGETRFESVKNGLALATKGSLIAVHDGVRPFVTAETLERCYDTAQQLGNAIPVSDAVESIRQISNQGNHAVNRTEFKMVQTPQVFQWEQISKAYSQPYSELFTDDASVIESMGYQINLVEGNRENIKITTPFDLLIGEALCNH
jgi:2-C-methyl-D-erythritol 4-phosphate cytidylyltransferase